jgi:hypothetical protein
MIKMIAALANRTTVRLLSSHTRSKRHMFGFGVPIIASLFRVGCTIKRLANRVGPEALTGILTILWLGVLSVRGL